MAMETRYEFNISLKTASLEYWDNTQVSKFYYDNGLISATAFLNQYPALYEDCFQSHQDTLAWVTILRSSFAPEELPVGDYDFQLECEPNKVKAILRSPHLTGNKLVDAEWEPQDDEIIFQPRPAVTDLPFGAYVLYLDAYNRFYESIQGHKQLFS